MSWAWQLLSVPVLIGLNAFFVAAEYAVVSIRSAQIQLLRNAGWRRVAESLGKLKADMPSAIGAIQVCITMTNLLLGWIGEPAMSELLLRVLGPLAELIPHGIFVAVSTAISFLVVTLLTVVMSELLPKALTLQHTILVAKLTAMPMLGIMRGIRPLVWIMNTMASAVTRTLGLGPVKIEGETHSADEIMVIASEAADAGVLSQRERSLILNTLGLGKKRAEQIMVPRVKCVNLDLRLSMDANFAIADQNLFSRMPLTDGGMDHIVGVIYTKEFLTAYHEGADATMLPLIAHRPVFVPVSISLDRLLPTFHAEKTRMLFLVDEYGGVDGMVTLTDVIDELLSSA